MHVSYLSTKHDFESLKSKFKMLRADNENLECRVEQLTEEVGQYERLQENSFSSKADNDFAPELESITKQLERSQRDKSSLERLLKMKNEQLDTMKADLNSVKISLSLECRKSQDLESYKLKYQQLLNKPMHSQLEYNSKVQSLQEQVKALEEENESQHLNIQMLENQKSRLQNELENQMPPLENSTENQSDLMRAHSALKMAQAQIAEHESEMELVREEMMQKVRDVTAKLLSARNPHPKPLASWERRLLHEKDEQMQRLKIQASEAQTSKMRLQKELTVLKTTSDQNAAQAQSFQMKIHTIKNRCEQEKKNLSKEVEHYRKSWEKEMKKVNQSRGEISLLKVQMEEYRMKSHEVDRLVNECRGKLKRFDQSQLENERLRSELERLRKDVNNLQKHSLSKDADISKLQKELTKLKSKFEEYRRIGQEKINKHWNNFIKLRDFLGTVGRVMKEERAFISGNTSLLEIYTRLNGSS